MLTGDFSEISESSSRGSRYNNKTFNIADKNSVVRPKIKGKV